MQDMHLHTKYSDGKNTVEEMICVAIQNNITEICFTDHVRANSTWIYDYVFEIRNLQQKYKGKIDINIGVEAKVVDFKGNLDCPEWVLQNEEIEKVAAIHRIPDNKGGFIRRDEIENRKKEALEYWIQTLSGIQFNPQISRLAHPFSLCSELGITSAQSVLWNDIIDALSGFGGALEWNIKYSYEMVPKEFWKKVNCQKIYGTDSHSVDDLRKRVELLKRY